MDIVILFISLGLILLGAEFFTNSIEWLGKKLHLSEGAVGSILAAVGTALPETLIPVIAILFGTEESGHEIGVGAILGAPFMLSTLAFFLAGIAVLVFKKNHARFPEMNIDPAVIKRDLIFFLIVYGAAIMAAFLKLHSFKIIVAIFLVAAYCLYVFFTLVSGNSLDEEHDLNPLYFNRKNMNPQMKIILFQVFISLAILIGGAKVFVSSIEHLSTMLGVPGFVLALIIAPVATELPEKFNSIIWISRGKDTLAMGNITGAMVFQSSLIPALGIVLTPWTLNFQAFISAAFALASTLIVYIQLLFRKNMTYHTLLSGGLFYIVFLGLIFTGVLR